MFEWWTPGEWWTAFFLWLDAWAVAIFAKLDELAALLAQLNPRVIMIEQAAQLIGQLPLPSGGNASNPGVALAALATVAVYLGYLDFFVNVPALLASVGLMLSIEISLLALRGWRIFRSLVT